MKKKIIIVFIVIIFIITFFVFNNKNEVKELEEIVINESIEENNNDIKKNIYKVDIKGAIVNPGVYEIEAGSRIIDVINMAGGLKEFANTSTINLSKFVKDEMVIIVYTNDEINNMTKVEPIIEYVEKECNCPKIENNVCIIEENNDLININEASFDELLNIPKIGESKAKDIIEYREKNGKFKSIDEIKNINGIKDAIFETIKNYITV